MWQKTRKYEETKYQCCSQNRPSWDQDQDHTPETKTKTERSKTKTRSLRPRPAISETKTKTKTSVLTLIDTNLCAFSASLAIAISTLEISAVGVHVNSSTAAACLSRPAVRKLTSYMRDHKIKILCKIVILVAGLVLVSAEKSETRRFETKIKTKTRGFETKTETKTKQTGFETGLETKTSLETSNTAKYAILKSLMFEGSNANTTSVHDLNILYLWWLRKTYHILH